MLVTRSGMNGWPSKMSSCRLYSMIIQDHCVRIKEHSKKKVALRLWESIPSLYWWGKRRPREIKWHAKTKEVKGRAGHCRHVILSLGLSQGDSRVNILLLNLPDAEKLEEKLSNLCHTWIQQLTLSLSLSLTQVYLINFQFTVWI